LGRSWIQAIRRIGRLALAGTVALLCLTSGDDRPSQLEQVLQRGSVTMLTRNGASTYYLGPEGPTGPETELARAFADFLGIELGIEVAAAFNRLERMLNNGDGDFIAANLTRTSERELLFNFGPDYLETTTLVIYRRGEDRPRSLADLSGRKIMVIAGSSYEEALETARREFPSISWEARSDVGMEELLLAVADGAIDLTLVDSNIFGLSKDFYPGVAAAFTLPGTLSHAWAFPVGSDDSLAQQARAFLHQFEHAGQLDALREAFYAPQDRMGRAGMLTFMRQVRERLPTLIAMFQEVAEAYGMDWRLLAAIAYQESHWDPDASSYTGVRGIMMLTRRTARQLGLTDRLDPRQSIDGGARYFLDLHRRIPRRIPEPDRTWMALAAYNMGMGHLEDARVLTQRQGGDPDSWADVDDRLELLSLEKYYSDTRYGYARGYEARQYVANIRRFYETLVWMDTQEHPLLITARLDFGAGRATTSGRSLSQ
jgi:membrane-bound lytic murein transglycosylase F